MTDVPCSKSVFADMNPDCPQYKAPLVDDPGALAAHDMIFETAAGTALTYTLGASGVAYFGIESQPDKGTVRMLNEVLGSFTYVPRSGFTGEDSFTFAAYNSAGAKSVGTVTITVTDASCVGSIYQTSTYRYRCDSFFEQVTVNFDGSIYTFRREEPSGGSFANMWQIQLDYNSGSIWVFTAENNVYQDGKEVRYELKRYTELHSDEREHVIATSTYDGSIKTTIRTRYYCNAPTYTRTVREIISGDGGYQSTVLEEETYDTDEHCPLAEDVETFAGTFMNVVDMSVEYALNSVPYRNYLADNPIEE
jgi:hypothetical protein